MGCKAAKCLCRKAFWPVQAEKMSRDKGLSGKAANAMMTGWGSVIAIEAQE
jgi:hypothetical protein